MTKPKSAVSAAAAALLLCSFATAGFAQQHNFEVVTGKPFDSALPKDFYLEGNAIPTAKRNAAMVHLPNGARAVISLIDTTGYSADIISKYVGMIITEGGMTLCGQKVTVGSYGFGWARPATGVDQPGKFSIYNQAGEKLAECATPRDAKVPQPRPLQLIAAKDGTARLYYGRHYLDMR